MPSRPVAHPAVAAQRTRAAQGLRAALALAALAFAAWAPSAVGAGFAFDDREAVEHNPVVEGSLPWTSAFERDYWEHRGAAGHFRPLATLSLRFDRALWGEHAAGFHATNVALHVLVVLAAALLAQRLFAREARFPWIGLGLFAVHPALADSVAWISGRSSMLAALPGLCAAIAIAGRAPSTDPRRGEGLRSFALGLAGTALASMGKEDGLLWAVALPCVAARHGRRAILTTALGCLAGAAAMFALRDHALGSAWIRAPNAPLAGVALPERLLVGGRALVEALRIVAWPAGFAPTSAGDPAFSASAVRAAPLLGVLGLLAWIAAAGAVLACAAKRRTLVAISAGLVLLAWLPFLQIVPSGEVFASRFLYLPLLFAGPLLQAGFELAFERRARLAAAMLLFAATAAAWSRGRVYSSRGAFREAVLAQRPDDVPSWNDLGLFFEESGEKQRANDAWRHATQLDPHYSRAWSNLGRVELSDGRPAAAVLLLERAVLEGPRNAVAQLNLGSARMAVGDSTLAEQAYRAAIRNAPGLAQAWEGLAQALRAQDRIGEARSAVDRALELEPGNPRALALAARLAR